jgi:arylsulfatase A-like enzyme
MNIHTNPLLKCGILWIASLILLGNRAQGQRPNIIYIMTDDMGYADMSGYGRKDYSTPHLDKLASQGIKFLNAYSAGPLCTPTRTAFITGRYPARTPVGLIEPLVGSKGDSTFGLTAEYPSVASLMRSGGYETALVGKWHLGFLPKHSPVKNGFDYFYGILSGAADYISHTGYAGKHDLYENDAPVYDQGYLTEMFTVKAISFIKQKHSKPFFLVLTYNAPHWPWQAPGDNPYHDTLDFRQGGSPATYAAMMKSLDDGIGALMKTLDDEQLSNQTIVIFTNDNGGERFSDNGIFTKSKNSLWEGGIRVPAFVRWPGKIAPGGVTTQAAITMDWTSTILSIGKIKPDVKFPLDGIDLMPSMKNNKTIGRTFYWRSTQRINQKAMKQANWKYLNDEGKEYLFDLEKDPSEKTDLKLKQTAIFERLKKNYAGWEAQMLTPIPL